MLNLLGRFFLEQARYVEADQFLVETIELSGQLSPPRLAGFEVLQRGEAAFGRGDLDRAEELLIKGLAVVDECSLIPFCVGWNNVAVVTLARGDVAAARESIKNVLPPLHLHNRRAGIFLITVAGLLPHNPAVNLDQVRTAVILLAYVAMMNERFGETLPR